MVPSDSSPPAPPAPQQTRASRAGYAAAPKLLVIVDTEEEFDWSRAYSRSAMGVDHIKYQHRAQAILERYGVRPTYVMDYPVASQEQGYRVLREWLADGRCGIGAHLHPWVNPPFTEELSARNSYPGNLPAELEEAKLKQLTETIAANFGRRPSVYRAGRYGLGPATAGILERLGYKVDTSIVPFTDFTRDGGPDFTAFDVEPFWVGPSKRVLEIPLTVAWCGQLRGSAVALRRWLASDVVTRFHLPGVLARLGLLERIRLTPEGTNFAELKRLVDTMLAAGRRLFVLSYHSPSVAPGNTPYVRNEAELQSFLALIERFCDYFLGTCNGEASTPHDVRVACEAGLLHCARAPGGRDENG
jgi:hypothetical protein